MFDLYEQFELFGLPTRLYWDYNVCLPTGSGWIQIKHFGRAKHMLDMPRSLH